MKVDDELISKLEKLSRIRIEDSEREEVKDQLSNMIQMVDKLQEVDTTSVTPLTHVHKYQNIEREDIVKNELAHEQAVKNAPLVKNRHIVVPKVIDK